MTDRLIARSSILALALASLGALSACESDSHKPEQLTRVSSPTVLATGLQPGDIAVTCIDTATGTDLLEVTPLVQPNGQVMYTDKEATRDGVFNSGETAGTPVPLTNIGVPFQFPAGDLNLGPTDQVFLYQGTILTPDGGTTANGNLLWGTQVGADWLRDGTDAAVTNNVSFIPSDLGPYAMAFFDTQDGGISGPDGGLLTARAYMGPTSGTKAVLQAAILDKGNWPFVTACPNRTLTVIGVDAGTDGPTGTGGTDGGTGGTDGGSATGGTDGGGSATGGTDGGSATGGTGGGAAGAAGTDAGTDVNGAAGAAGTDAGNDVATPTDAGNDVRIDAGNDTPSNPDVRIDVGNDVAPPVDVRPDTGTDVATPTDVRPDMGPAGTDARTDVAKADAGTDAPKASSSSGCSCSTAVGRDGLSASAWMLAIAGVLFTARRKNKKRR